MMMKTSREQGNITISGLIFYTASFLIMLSIPVTIYLLNFPTQNLQSSASIVNYKSTPTIELMAEPVQIKSGEKVRVTIKTENSNFYRVFYAKTVSEKLTPYLEPLSTLTEIPASAALITEGARDKEELFTPPFTGYLFAVAYQLKNTIADFRGGDIMCGWDSTLYIYKKHKDSIVTEILSDITKEEPKSLGRWDKVTLCNNTAPIKIEVQ